MRNTLQITILATLILSAGCAKYDRELLGDPQPEPAQVVVEDQAGEPVDGPVDERGTFDDLAYYGQWHWVDPYGWVWHPNVVVDYQPFTNGRWIWTEYGWMWVDYDNWGWATSHYGYWTNDYVLGWVWIPDYTWEPVRCNWVVYDDYVCWSPIPPPQGHYRDPWEDEQGWVSVPMRKFKSQNVSDYRSMPKFKAKDPGMVHRSAPEVNVLAKHGSRFSPVDVRIDHYAIGAHEMTKVFYPSDLYPAPITNPVSAPITQPPIDYPAPPVTIVGGGVGGGGGGGNVAPPPSQGGKSKGSNPPSNKDSGKKTETKYKSKKSNDNNKDSGKSGGDSKDDSTSKKKKGKKG